MLELTFIFAGVPLLLVCGAPMRPAYAFEHGDKKPMGNLEIGHMFFYQSFELIAAQRVAY